MLKIEQFVEQNFGIKLTKHQLEMIAIMAASPEREFILQNTGRSSGKTVAFKAAMAYLQDGMKPVPPKITINVNPPEPEVRFVPIDRGGMSA